MTTLQICAKVICFHPSYPSKVLLARRQIPHFDPLYEPLGGRVHPHVPGCSPETLEQCALREISEEIGVGIGLGPYLGNYSFSWMTNPHHLSYCVVFLGKLVQLPSTHIGQDSCAPLQLEWVSLEDLGTLNPISPQSYGLRELFLSLSQIYSLGQFPFF